MADCFANIRGNEKFKDITDSEIKEMIKELDTIKNEGAEYFKKAHDTRTAMINNAENRAHKMANFTFKKTEIIKDFNSFTAKGFNPKQYVQKLLGGFKYVAEGGFMNFDRVRKSFTEIQDGRAREIFGNNLLKLQKDNKWDLEIARYIDAKKESKDLSSFPKHIADSAEAFRKYYDMQFTDLRNGDVYVNYREDYIGKSTHNPDLMIDKKAADKGFKAWFENIYPMLDKDKSFVGQGFDVHKKVLKEFFNEHVTWKETGGVTKKISGLQHSREFIFKDQESFVNYNTRYGMGSLFNNLIRTTSANSRIYAEAKLFGDTNEMMKFVDGKVKQHFKDKDDMKGFEDYNNDNDLLIKRKNIIKNAIGFDHLPDNALSVTGRLAGIANRIAFLGNATVNSIADVATAAMSHSAFTGQNGYAISQLNILKNIVQNADIFGATRSKVLERAKVMVDYGILAHFNRYGIDGDLPIHSPMTKLENMGRMMEKTNLLEWWTNMVRASGIDSFMSAAHDYSDLPYDKLNDQFKRTLIRSSISADDWDVLRLGSETVPRNFTDTKAITVKSLEEMPIEYFTAGAATKKMEVEKYKSDLILKYKVAIDSLSQNYISPQGNIVTQSMINRGFSPQTWEGQLFRQLGTFMSYQTQLTHETIPAIVSQFAPAGQTTTNAWHGLKYTKQIPTMAAGAVSLILLTRLSGELSRWTKGDFSKSWDDKEEMLNATSKALLPVMTAMGADFFRGQYFGDRRDLTESFMGVPARFLKDTEETASIWLAYGYGMEGRNRKPVTKEQAEIETIKYAGKYAPIPVHTFWNRRMFERAVTHQLINAVDPKYLDRQERLKRIRDERTRLKKLVEEE
jgi:hypothetical protein